MGGSMSSVVISGDTSGAITLAAPSVSGTNTATLPAATGTVLLSTTQLIGNGTTTNNDASEFLIKPTFTPEVEAIDQSEAAFFDLPRNLKL
jgi:hypothetical protein